MTTPRTGDVVLFSSNSPTGFLLRTFVSSTWSHSGVAVRMIKDGNKMKITLDDSGDLYILETNTGTRYDDYFEEELGGVGFSRAEWSFLNYNRIAHRPLKECFRTKMLIDGTLEFAHKFKGKKFPSSALPFLSVWLGINLSDSKETMFCSQMMVHYYHHAVGKQFPSVIGMKYGNNWLSALFGSTAPGNAELFAPEHYTMAKTPYSPMFSGPEKDFYFKEGDLWYTTIQPILLILFFVLLLWMSQRRGRGISVT